MRSIVRITTPENVPFEHELAGVPSRAVAWAIDVVVMGVAIAVTARIAEAFGAAGGFASAVALLAVFLVQWWYGALCEWWLGGQTIGKRAVGLRVLDERGFRIGFVQAVVRNLVRVADLLPGLYLVGGVSALVDVRGRRLGDLAAGTIVVRERPRPAPSALVPPAERQPFADDPAVRLAVRRISASERDAMIALGLRRDQLPLGVRHALFARLAEHLEARLGMDRPAYLSAERFVLNLTAILVDG
ncbi:RDD family protein [Sandaracinus amylolyticus]|uniref:Integral membrane protein n=1 Tax=Sandaracinus amylolyticus TaxID=927083 RepID=A0A0F6W5F0_9BACT|nr:RDD family protein [Sandaracinus amylolyticus]AKF07765.1 Integral membrane protein [Sandaracinus amylolyticus]